MRWLVLILTVTLIGCTTGRPTVSPTLAGAGSSPEVTSAPQYQVWVDGRFAWNAADETLEFIPTREGEAFFDVWPLLNPPHCHNCVSIQVLSHDKPAHLLTVEVLLMNPIGLSGWFVRGLVYAPESSGVELIGPDGFWHSEYQAHEDQPAPFMTFGDYGPGETHSAVYAFHYEDPPGFSQCSYRVIVRYPEHPGEVTFLGHEQLHGALTKLGGFCSLRADMVADDTAPPVTVQQFYPPGSFPDSPLLMRHETGDTYLSWLEGEPTTDDAATVWITAPCEGYGENYLAWRVDVPVIDVTPEPNRAFPLVGEGVRVFVDQLTTGMTPGQTGFMATHCVGSQKLVKSLADSLREYNPDFIVIQYHLAFGAGDISNIHGNDWVKNWDFEDAQEDFFEHRSWSTQPNQRVLQVDWNWYLTDPVSDWVLYFIGNTLERMDPLGDQFDGVFADSASQPWNTDPEKWWEGSDDPHDMFVYWTPKTQEFFDRVSAAYHTLPTYYYLIPNAGSYVTTISDITYYQCDGVMIEGFAHWGPESYFTEEDWRLQMNRVRDLATQDKIILCQTDVEVDDTVDRCFTLGSYAMILDNYTYFNMLGPWGLEPQWWPEYHWNVGEPIEDWADVEELQDSGGCYARHFENGIVIVNPSDETRYYTTTKMYSHTMFALGGLLPADGEPTGVATGPLVEPGEQEIPPHSCWLGAG